MQDFFVFSQWFHCRQMTALEKKRRRNSPVATAGVLAPEVQQDMIADGLLCKVCKIKPVNLHYLFKMPITHLLTITE